MLEVAAHYASSTSRLEVSNAFIIIMLLFLVLSVAIAEPPCNASFAGAWDMCDNELTFCYEHLFCDDDYMCEPDNTGEMCSTDEDCYSGTCSMEECVGQLASGDGCLTDQQCAHGHCDAGSKAKCVGTLEGDTCDPGIDGICDRKLFCDYNSHKCVEQIKEGHECLAPQDGNFDQQNSVCEAGYICNPTDNTYTSGLCTLMGSIKEGGTAFYVDLCELGLGIDNGKCAKVTTCDTELSNKLCAQTSYCKCDNVTDAEGTCVQLANTDCGSEYKDWVDCIEDHHVVLYNSHFGPWTRQYHKCFEEVRDLDCCMRKGFESTFYTRTNIYCDDTPVTCDIGFSGLGDKCDNVDLICANTLFCNLTTDSYGVCIEDNTGHSCVTDGSCASGLCVNGTCRTLVGPGDYCLNDKQCATSQCKDHVCQGVANGAVCDPVSELCNAGYFCKEAENPPICSKIVPVGEDCITPLGKNTGWQELLVCGGGVMCSPTAVNSTDGICMELFSVKEGHWASDPMFCEPGLSLHYGYCTDSDKCTVDSDIMKCDEFSSCMCKDADHFMGECESWANDDCEDEIEDWSKCIQKNKCLEFTSAGPDSCVYAHCLPEYTSLSCCMVDDHEDTYFPQPWIKCPSKGIGTWGWIGIGVGAAAVIALIAIPLARRKGKKKQDIEENQPLMGSD